VSFISFRGSTKDFIYFVLPKNLEVRCLTPLQISAAVVWVNTSLLTSEWMSVGT
jgi:hypothetical protein